jgi:predicted metalloprotease with PDZ domain
MFFSRSALSGMTYYSFTPLSYIFAGQTYVQLMLKYTVTAHDPHKHYIDITFTADTQGEQQMLFQLPAWRPGRYELANFAQNIQYWQATNERREALPFRKITKDCWEVLTEDSNEVTISYNYYANQLDAGASYFDHKQLYINPVNCMLYIPSRIDEECEIELLEMPDEYRVACSLNFDEDLKATAQSFHELADSPFIVSDILQHEVFDCKGYTFHIWMQGIVAPDWHRIKHDFGQFAEAQINMFKELPVQEYHFLFQMLNTKFYHGVEHLANTVIALGPGYQLMQREQYSEFLSISSHELFHSWNIKSIRPEEMYPYDYTKENYTNLGYVAEGVTTYYGDLMLLRSGGFSWSVFASEKDKDFQRHFESFGRYFQSLSEASFDSWLDGYKPGAPDRKISFYLKGAIVAFMLDIFIRRDTKNKESLDTVMRELYDEYAKKGRGYTEQDYLEIISRRAGQDYEDFFIQYIWGLEDIEEDLQTALQYVGCEMIKLPAMNNYERNLGLKIREEMAPIYKCLVNQVHPGSPADESGLAVNDEIVAVNGMRVNQNLAHLIQLQEGNTLELSIIRNGEVIDLDVYADDETYFPIYHLIKIDNATPQQRQNFESWAGQIF